MPEKKNKISKGASKKKAMPKLVIPPFPGETKTDHTQRSIGIGTPVDEKTLREMKENAKKM
jgi:hypothetical protein